MIVQTGRIYVPARAEHGFRVLVDRLWPRGVSKVKAAIDLWARDLAPSSDLRIWFHQDAARFNAFSERYLKELSAQRNAAHALIEMAAGRVITLLTAARDPVHNHVVVLRDLLLRL